MINFPMCGKCCNKILVKSESGTYFTLAGCKENPEIKNFNDAQVKCPLLGKEGKEDVEAKVF